MIKKYCKGVRDAHNQNQSLSLSHLESLQDPESLEIAEPEKSSEEQMTSQNGDITLNPVKFTSSSEEEKNE